MKKYNKGSAECCCWIQQGRVSFGAYCVNNREELLRKIKDDDGGNFRPFVVGSICKPSVLTLAEGANRRQRALAYSRATYNLLH